MTERNLEDIGLKSQKLLFFPISTIFVEIIINWKQLHVLNSQFNEESQKVTASLDFEIKKQLNEPNYAVISFYSLHPTKLISTDLLE